MTEFKQHTQKSYSTMLFLVVRMTQYSCLLACHLLWYFIKTNKQKKNIQVTISDTVVPEQTTPDHFEGLDNILLYNPGCLYFYFGSSSMIILDTEFQPVDASPLG